MLLLERDDAKIQKGLHLKKRITAPASTCEAGLKCSLCVVKLAPIEVDTPLRPDDFRTQRPLRALTLDIEQGLLCLIQLANTSLCDGKIDASPYHGLHASACRQRLLKKHQSIGVVTLIDQDLRQLDSERSSPFGTTQFKLAIGLFRLLSAI